jgi:hypothetical protein
LQRDLFINTDTGDAVRSLTDSSIVDLPPFVQENSLSLRIWLLKNFPKAGGGSAEAIPVAGVTLEVAIGLRTGNSSTYYTQQFTWTPSTDLAQPYFAAVLPMNTNAIANLLGSGSSAQAWLEVTKIADGLPETVLQKLITIQAAVIKSGTLVVAPGLTPLSAEAAMAAFVAKSGIQGPIPFIGSNGKVVMLDVDDSGQFRADPVT